MSLIAGRGCRWPPRRDSVSPCAPLSGGGGRDTHDGHENSPILVFFSNLLDACRGRGAGGVGHANHERGHLRTFYAVAVYVVHVHLSVAE